MGKYLKHFNISAVGVLIVMGIHIAGTKVNAQKVLSVTESRYVTEAYADLEETISNPVLTESSRIWLVEKSAKTLKEYGQKPAFPNGDIPLKVLYENNYNRGMQEFNDANNLMMAFSNKVLDSQLKIINTLQIEVVEEQIKIMLPGLPAPFELSKDLAATFFKLDFAEGFSAGKYSDASSLVTRFKQLAETKTLIKQLESFTAAHRESMQNLYRDLNMVKPLQERLRKRYEIAANSTPVQQGYAGAILPKNQMPENADHPLNTPEPEIVENDDGFKETKFYYRLLKTETVKKVNNPGYVESISVAQNSMSASVNPPKPKEPFTTTAKWGSPPSAIYPGDLVIITAKGTGDARIRIEASNSRTLFQQGVRTTEGDGNSSVVFKWEVGGGSENMAISIHTSVTANTWAWTASWFMYEYVVIE
jgi:hypothetical protein